MPFVCGRTGGAGRCSISVQPVTAAEWAVVCELGGLDPASI
jgi:predicted RNA-binding protein with PUA-like domain